MPARPCPLPCPDAHEPTDRSLSPLDFQRDPSLVRTRRTSWNLTTHARRCAAILGALVVSTAALTACTRAEAEPPITQTSADTSATTTVTPTPGPANVRITNPPSDPDLHLALRQYGRFEAALMAQAHTGGSPDSRRMVEAVTHPEGDAREFARILADQHAKDGPQPISGTLVLSEHVTTHHRSSQVKIHACWSPEELSSEHFDISEYQTSDVIMVKRSDSWVVGSFKTEMGSTCS